MFHEALQFIRMQVNITQRIIYVFFFFQRESYASFMKNSFIKEQDILDRKGKKQLLWELFMLPLTGEKMFLKILDYIGTMV